MNNTLENFLYRLDIIVGLNQISSIYWLILVLISFLTLTLLCLNSRIYGKSSINIQRHKLYLLIYLLALLSAGFTLVSFVYSYATSYFYSIHVVLSLIIQLLVLYMLANTLQLSTYSQRLVRFTVHFNAITIIFILAAKYLIRGLDAQETVADTINIFFNGRFAFSMHAEWYDLAPVDSLIKVALLRVLGNDNPYSPLETSMIALSLGLSIYLIVYNYVKNKRILRSLIPLIPALLMIHPYSFLSEVFIPPTNIATALALTTIMRLISPSRNQTQYISNLLIAGTLFTVSALAHPFSLIALMFVILIILSKYIATRTLTKQEILILVLFLIIWLLKTIYTATIHGIVDTYNTVMSGLFSAVKREELLRPRNVRYLTLPKLALASYSVSLGIISGLALKHLYCLVKKRNTSWQSILIILSTLVIGLLSLIGAIGGYSRYLVTPAASIFFILIMLNFEARKDPPSSYFLLLITISAILTVLNPIVSADQYSFPTVNKLQDKTMYIIEYQLFTKLDPTYITEKFYGSSDMKLYMIQESKFFRMPSTHCIIVEKVILQNIVKARSYWDFVGRGPFEYLSDEPSYGMDSVIFSSNLLEVIAS